MKRIIYLTLAVLVLLGSVSVYATGSDYPTERYYSHESRPHIPSPYNQTDVAAGVGISTVGIVVINALTKTSVFGSASFNGSFNPQAAPGSQPGAGPSGGSSPGATGSVPGSAGSSAGTSGTSAGMASTASATQGTASASLSHGAAASSGGGGFLKSIGDFFKGLFDVLRDMLTDEGRSYASGRVTDILSETNFSDFSENE